MRLPPLVEELPQSRSIPKLTRDDVVLLSDKKLNGVAPAQTDQLLSEFEMFVVGNRPPIYVVGTHLEIIGAIALYERGYDKYLRYTFAALLGHEWAHAFQQERSEVRAYAFELQLLRKYLANGSLPPECIADAMTAEKRLLDAEHAERHEKLPTLELLPKR